jgi:predicted DNA-binding transcriptional regulator AlpA
MKETANAAPSEAVPPSVIQNSDTSTVAILTGYIEPHQLATELGISDRTLARWHAMRVGPPRVTIGRKPYYRRSSVAEWIAKREFDPAADTGRRRRA